MREAAGIRRMGAAALDLAYVAAGRYDAYFEFGLKSWDVAGGGLLVQEAGGRVTRPDGGEGYVSSGNVLATNGRLHPRMLALLGRASSAFLGQRGNEHARPREEELRAPCDERNGERARWIVREADAARECTVCPVDHPELIGQNIAQGRADEVYAVGDEGVGDGQQAAHSFEDDAVLNDLAPPTKPAHDGRPPGELPPLLGIQRRGRTRLVAGDAPAHAVEPATKACVPQDG